MSVLPIVAVIGRPNVGKSTLINRIVRRRDAVVDEQAGVTRDRREFIAEWNGRRFVLVDTGGWEATPDEQLALDVRGQTRTALENADLVLLVADSQAAVTDDDQDIARVLLRSGLPYVFVANKVDGSRQESDLSHLWTLGLGKPLPVSAAHGRGAGDFLDTLVNALPVGESQEEPDAIASLAIIGRPNVGKSTLLNKLAGRQRVLVSDIPGTTRDPINLIINLDGEPFEIIDTAGIKRRTKIQSNIEFFSVLRARNVLKQADIALLLIDGLEGATQQDQRLAEEVVEAGVGLVILLNKWDAVNEQARMHTESTVADRLGFVGWAPVLRMSARTGARTHRISAAVRMVLENRRRRIPTPELNRHIRKWQEAHPAPVRKGKRPRTIYAVQAEVRPPTVVLFVRGGDLGPEYLRFLGNRIRREYDLVGTPIRIHTRRRHRLRKHGRISPNASEQ